jgi:ATP/maltotriose-dependent transcriptional regulator MalT
VAGEWPLVGRRRELSLVSTLVGDPEHRGVFLAGAAGVGKSRLAAECLAVAKRSGMPTARASATRSSARLPFGALAPLLPPTEATSLGAPHDWAGFLRRGCEALSARAEDKRLVLFLDDAHLLDDASATLVHQLVQTGSTFLLATVLTGEPAPDALAALWKEGAAERIEVATLQRDAIEEVLTAALGAPLESSALSRLAVRSGGNMLFLRELVLGALASGALTQDGDLWRLVASLTPSDRIVELVGDRLRGLEDSERAYMELLAVGEPLGIADLDGVAHSTVAETLERQGLLRTRLNGRRLELRLGHPLYGEVLRDGIRPIRLQTINRLLADAVEGVGARRREDVLRVATWRLGGGGTIRPELMLTAGRQARAGWALPLAERLSRAAVDAGAGFPARLLLGQICWLGGRSEEAEITFAAAVPYAVTDEERAALAGLRMDNLAMGQGRFDLALVVAAEVEKAIADEGCRNTVSAQRARLVLLSGDIRTAIAVSEPIVARAEGPALVEACITAASALGLSGRAAQALELTQRGLEAHLALSPDLALGSHTHLLTRVVILNYSGRLAEAEALARAEHDRAVGAESVEMQGLSAAFLSRVLLSRGAAASAARVAHEARVLLQERNSPFFLRFALMFGAHAQALLRRTEAARSALAELDSLNLPPTLYFGPELALARAWTEVAAGDLAGARRWLYEAVAMADTSGELVLQEAALHDLARLGNPEVAAASLRQLADRLEGDLGPARADHAEARIRDDPDALEHSSTRFEALGANLLAAEAAADAAVSRRRAGDTRRAAAAERRAAILTARCEGAATPGLQPIEARVFLTRAEREVALLAAAGRSNPEIAEALTLSRKTVENYLHRSYQKLGISGRDELPGALQV